MSKETKATNPKRRRGHNWIISTVLLTTLAILVNRIRNVYLQLPLEYAVCSGSGKIYTVDELNPQVQCLIIQGSRIAHTSSLDNVERLFVQRRTAIFSQVLDTLTTWIGSGPRIIHTKPGSIIIPGLADAHGHILGYGFKMNLKLDGADSVDEIIDRVRSYIEARPDVVKDKTRWIEGMGWDQLQWEGKEFPTAADLDRDPVLRGRPIALSRVDGHASWVSNRVLELMGDLPDEVEGGAILRDATSKPTGVFLDSAMYLIPKPAWSNMQMEEYFETAMRDALRHGLTSIHDAMSSPDMISFFKKAADQGRIPMRLYLMGNVESFDYWGSQIERLENYGVHGRLNVRSVKLVGDGALGSSGAALLEPYSDDPNATGILRIPPEILQNLVNKFWKDGWQTNIHCIGDRANKIVLDIYEDILEKNGGDVTKWRPRIEHAQIMTQGDLQRMARLRVVASVQPTHATSDMAYAESRLGPERIKGAYAYQTLLETSPNKVLPLGSDFPVEDINPLLGFYAAVSRLSVNGESPHGTNGWFPEQRLNRAQTLKGMTLDAAYAAFGENEYGSLEPGKRADFVVLDRDIMDENTGFANILETQVLATVVDGEVVYGDL